MKIALGADHGGFPLKQKIKTWLEDAGHHVTDVGALSFDAEDDYPDYAILVARSVGDQHSERGIIVCGSGVGAGVAANKVAGVRCAVCHDTYSARQGVEHDDMNVLSLGGRIVGEALAREIVSAFVSATFSGEERHVRRLRKVQALDAARTG